MFPRKQLYGHAKRENKKADVKLVQSMAGSILKFFPQIPSAVQENLVGNRDNQTGQESNPEIVVEEIFDAENENTNNDGNNDEENEHVEPEENNGYTEQDRDIDEDIETKFHSVDIYDPRTWDGLDSKMRELLIEKGPVRETNFIYPKDEGNRHFSTEYYHRVFLNRTTHERKWLVYSKELDRVFCFCCKLFKTVPSRSQLAGEGYRDWRHLSDRLKDHEKSHEHFANLKSLKELELRLKENKTIDKELQKQITDETRHWKGVLIRIIAVVKCLAILNLAFRGKNEKIDDESNGNFLGLIEMIAEFDPIMQEYFRLIRKKEIHYHYLSHKIQNELIANISWNVKLAIIEKVKKAGYYSVILDCTPDASHKEQMTLILRYVDVSRSPVEIQENFIEFLQVDDTTGLGLFNTMISALESFGLDIDKIRGKGYDNGSNMRGKYKGVQSMLLEKNSRAFYMPCGCHNLNLVLCDLANSCNKAKSFFGACQCLYTVFCHSTKRWKVLLECVKGPTLKALCTTRWESHIESVKAIKSQVGPIKEALLKVVDLMDDAKMSRDARLLITQELSSFEFLVSLVIWYDILHHINLVSKSLQSETMHIEAAVKHLKGLVSFFEKYREEGFESAIISATELAFEVGVDPEFPEVRQVSRKRQFDEIDNTERERQTTKERFRTDYFLVVVDVALSELVSRFEHLKVFENMFGFLFDGLRLMSTCEDDLKSCCDGLEVYLTKDGVSDVDANELFVEIKFLKEMLPSEAYDPAQYWTAVKILNFIVEMDIFPAVLVAYQILLTLPVTVASAERSFSKLKLLKSYLRTTMSQDRLNGLAILCIEKEMLEGITYDQIIEDFASKNARRMHLR